MPHVQFLHLDWSARIETDINQKLCQVRNGTVNGFQPISECVATSLFYKRKYSTLILQLRPVLIVPLNCGKARVGVPLSNTGKCRWMGSHFHDWIDYNRVTRMWSHIFGIWGVRIF